MSAQAPAPWCVGRDRLFAILCDARELVPRKRAYHKTTHSHHRFRRHPNLLKAGPEQVVASGPEQVWVADITYLPTQESVAYVSLVTDAYSRKIVGHHGHGSLHTESVIKALQKAVSGRKTTQLLIHHLDRGAQYCSDAYEVPNSIIYHTTNDIYYEDCVYGKCKVHDQHYLKTVYKARSMTSKRCVATATAIGCSR